MTRSRLRLPVFDAVERRNPSPQGHGETSFQFLNRVEGDFWEQVRGLIQEWMGHVPCEEDYRDLRGRLRADDAANFSAFLELYLHEFFLRAGYRVSIHPSVSGSDRRPDFLVEGHGESFYLEATMPGPRQASQGRAHRRADFLDTIQGCKNRNFFLSLDHLVVGPAPARGRVVRRRIERWLEALDPDVVTYEHEHRETYCWEDAGWEARFSAIPVSPEHRGRPDHRPIGVYADGGVEFIDDAPTIQGALAAKATAYGELDRPLLIALGTYIWDTDRWHSTNALYGHGAVTWWGDADGAVAHASTRQPDGFFGTPEGWANQGVAAVLHVNQLQPSHLQRAELTLWPHPAASAQQLRELADRVPVALVRPSAGVLETSPPSVDPAQHFGLPDPWPAGEAFPRG